MHRLIPALLLFACGGPTDELPLIRLVPEISAAPEPIDFGEQTVSLQVSERVFITNAGRATLSFEAALAGDGAAVYSLPFLQGEVEAGETLTLDVTFLPETFLTYEAELVLTSNDEDTPELRLPITGEGVAGPLPDLSLSTQTLDFGETESPVTDLITIKNTGTAPLYLGSIAQSGSGAFTLLADPSGNTLAAGDSTPLVIQYTPNPDGDSGELRIPSNDPDTPEALAILIGNGGAEFGYPEAVIDCPGPVDPPLLVTLDGSGSNDPEGHLPLSYEWTLTQVPETPDGTPLSTTELTSNAGPSTGLFADVVGSYTVQLVVVNQLGTRSAPTLCEVVANPGDAIEVELTWDTPNADLDLHLSEGNADLFERPGDANWCNTSPDWGAQGDASDDPDLELDDRAGFGPENMRIEQPADGTYDVKIHYFEEQGDATVEATVRIYTLNDPVPAFEASRLMNRNEVWVPARINWPDGTVGALSAANVIADRRQCFTP